METCRLMSTPQYTFALSFSLQYMLSFSLQYMHTITRCSSCSFHVGRQQVRHHGIQRVQAALDRFGNVEGTVVGNTSQ
jgi:hypothetical protein